MIAYLVKAYSDKIIYYYLFAAQNNYLNYTKAKLTLNPNIHEKAVIFLNLWDALGK